MSKNAKINSSEHSRCKSDSQDDKPSTSWTHKHLVPELTLHQQGHTLNKAVPWKSLKLPKQTDLHKHMYAKIVHRMNTDAVVKIEGYEFKVHLMVLQTYSNYFLCNVLSVYEFSGKQVSYEAFPVVYQWMILCEPESHKILNSENLLQVLRAAQFLKIPALEEQCWTILDDPRVYSEHSAYCMFIRAHDCGFRQVEMMMLLRIVDFFITLVTSATFLELPHDKVKLLLSSDNIKVNCEQEIFLSAIRWLFHDWKTRKEFAFDIMQCVRFAYIKPDCLLHMNLDNNSPEVEKILTISEINKLRTDWVEHSELYFSHLHQPAAKYHRLIENIAKKPPLLRNYAHPNFVHHTYKDFLFYLHERRSNIILRNVFKNV